MNPARVLVIAGSDSSGGAGVQADIKTITALGGYAASALTALTAQNTRGVQHSLALEPNFVRRQIQSVLSDIGADAIKIGMLADASIIQAVAQELRPLAKRGMPVVLDPVMVSSTGHALLDPNAEESLREELLPIVSIITPNEHEAARLTGLAVRSRPQMERAARNLHRSGAKAVLVTGGEGKGKEVSDLLVHKGVARLFSSPRLQTKNTHGSGCTLASAIAVSLAQGFELLPAISRARAFVHDAIRTAPNLGKGTGPVNHLCRLPALPPDAIPFYQVDAFADRLFKGNPAAVCPLKSWPSDDLMQSIAAENNLAETAFFAPEGKHFRLRWFSPTVEVQFCGHATLASAHVIFNHLYPSAERVVFETLRGQFTVTRADKNRLAMNLPAEPHAPCSPPAGLEDALGARPAETFKGPNIIALFPKQQDVARLKPNMEALAKISRTNDGAGLIAAAPGDSCDVVSRFFGPAYGIPEDQATGSAHCMIAPLFAKRLKRKTIHARQISPRGGTLLCRIAPRGRVILEGHCADYAQGHIRLSDFPQAPARPKSKPAL